MLSFTFLPKNKFNQFSEKLFEILSENMTKIAPTGNAYLEDYQTWNNAVGEGIKKDNRQIIIISSNTEIIGYFQYYTDNDIFMMEEIQLAPKYQGESNVFRLLYGFVLAELSSDIQFVEAYANKLNEKSNCILKRLGLKIIGENKSKTSFHYSGYFSDLLNWYNHIK